MLESNRISSGGSSTAVFEVTSPPLYHVLMEDDSSSSTNQSNQQLQRLVLHRRMKCDYLARRFRAFQDAQLTDASSSNDEQATFWNGASDLEKSLAACCCIGGSTDGEVEHNIAEYDQQNYPGALVRQKIVTFVGLLALHCHSVASRALALAILERSQQADENEKEIWVDENDVIHAETEEASETSSTCEAEPQLKRRRRSKDEGEESEYYEDEADVALDGKDFVFVHSMSPSVVRVQRKIQPSRLIMFLKAGGLPILSRWLMECSTPIPASHLAKTNAIKGATKERPQKRNSLTNTSADGPTNVDDDMVASPTGPLLLPLLLFLQKLPFDLQAIKLSKINKKIKILSKSVDAILPPPEPKTTSPGRQESMALAPPAVDTRTDPVAGGLQVALVQKAVNDLKNVWEENATKAKSDTSKCSPEAKVVADPFAAFKEGLEDRLKYLNKHESAISAGKAGTAEELPKWLADVLMVRKQKLSSTAVGKNKSRQTTEEMARKERERERENERLSKNKENLEKAQRERCELLQRLRALKQNDASLDAAKRNVAPAPMGHRVRWKDGYGSSSSIRNREILEEVLVFVKEKDILVSAEDDVVMCEASRVASTTATDGLEVASQAALQCRTV